MPTYDVVIIPNGKGRAPMVVDTVKGNKSAAKKATKEACDIWFPQTQTKWSNDALVVSLAGEYVATVAFEPADDE